MNSTPKNQIIPTCTIEMGTSKLRNKWDKEESELPILPEQIQKTIDRVVGKLIYYGQAVDPTLLVALGSMVEKQ